MIVNCHPLLPFFYNLKFVDIFCVVLHSYLLANGFAVLANRLIACFNISKLWQIKLTALLTNLCRKTPLVNCIVLVKFKFYEL